MSGFGPILPPAHRTGHRVPERSLCDDGAMPGPWIRPLRADDVEVVVAAWRRSRIAAMPGLEARMGHTLEDDRAHFRESVLPDHDVWVAAEGGRVIGLLTLQGDRLGHLYVDPPAQGRGIGSALLDHAKALSPSGLALFTHVRNERARAFYERRGFVALRFGVSPPPESEPDVEYRWDPPSRPAESELAPPPRV